MNKWLRNHVCGKLRILLLYYTLFKIFICIHGIIVNSDLVYQHLCETEHLYYLFGSSSKRITPLCHLVDDILVLTLKLASYSDKLAYISALPAMAITTVTKIRYHAIL